MSYKKLIICDDDQNYCLSLKRILSTDGWTLVYTETLEDLKKDLAENANEYFAIILDIKGRIDSKQSIEDSGFIGSALKYLDNYFPGIPRAILSGEERDFGDIKKYHREEKVFQKSRDGQDALKILLKEYADNSEIYKIRVKEPELYEIFEKAYLKNISKSKLDNLLKHKLEVEKMPPGQLFNQCRELMEDIFTALNQKSNSYLADELFTGESMNQLGCIQYLNGWKVKLKNFHNREISRAKITPNFINAALMTIYVNSGKGLHSGDIKPTSFTEMTTIFACLDCLKWFKDFMDSKDPYKE